MSMNEIVDAIPEDKARTRRRHAQEFKAQILAAFDLPGGSVAKVVSVEARHLDARRHAAWSVTAVPPHFSRSADDCRRRFPTLTGASWLPMG